MTFKAFGVGEMSIQLPERLKIVYNGINVSIGIPPNLIIKIKKNGKYISLYLLNIISPA